MELLIKRYTEDIRERWDRFILKESMNGTFLQTRKFINYHPQSRFADHSLIVYKGKTIVACILASELMEEGGKVFFSHKGTTFGGIIVAEQIYNTTNIAMLMDCFEEYLLKECFARIYLKMTPSIFSRKSTELLDYYLYQRGYIQYTELNYYINLMKCKGDILGNFSSGKRRDYRYSLKNGLRFQKLESYEEIKEFYEVLQLNLKKLGLHCVHTFEELLDLKYNRFNEKIEFYGVYYEKKMVAGSMLFLFDERVIHTQYLASDEQYLKMYPMDFLIYNLICCAIEKSAKIFTFGVCTENQGKYLNLGLSRFKEGFGTEYCLNKSFEKVLDF